MEVRGEFWAFWAFDKNHKEILVCPGLIQMKRGYFDVEQNGLKANFYNNALFKSKDEALDRFIGLLEDMKNG